MSYLFVVLFASKTLYTQGKVYKTNPSLTLKCRNSLISLNGLFIAASFYEASVCLILKDKKKGYLDSCKVQQAAISLCFNSVGTFHNTKTDATPKHVNEGKARCRSTQQHVKCNIQPCKMDLHIDTLSSL